VADRDEFAHKGAVIVGQVDDGAVLHIRPWADDDPIDVAAQDGLEPDARFFLERDIADHVCARGDIGRGMNGRFGVQKTREAVGQGHGKI
jgi:hypothetical protein